MSSGEDVVASGRREEIVVACTSDLAGKIRGKGFPATQFDKRLARGIGWTPTNVQITCFDTIAETPFGSLGDLVLIPDAGARVRLPLDEGDTAESFVMGAIHYTDGRPWEFCTRSILSLALERLGRVAGLRVRGAFEHEFQFRDGTSRRGDAFSLAAMRDDREFVEMLLAAQRALGVVPDTLLKEFGADQYEVTMGPQEAVAIADHSVFLRQAVSAVAHKLNRRVTFTPIRDPAAVGNGVHVHLSLLTSEGQPATFDPDRPYGLSELAGQFVAGILKYLDSFLAITAPSRVSYLRLTPHRWSAAFNNLGVQDREAAVRICPVSEMSDVSREAQFHFEFRAADGAGSPYLQLAALIHAGVQGIEEQLVVPAANQEDPSLLSESALKGRGLKRLPQSLSEALERFEQNPVVAGWFPERFVQLYVAHKKGELSHLAGASDAEACAAYETVY